ncbi:hypothetical protein [Streptomyces sp. NPDC046371]|uniref:hypothetical protein n=1 Tax=Streptomyces sp. NPDC046371 TaxID=3154916 RepID=UPI0033EE27EA
MQTFRIMWTQAGQDERKVSAVSYDEPSAKTYAERKAKEDGVTNVEITKVKPGM